MKSLSIYLLLDSLNNSPALNFSIRTQKFFQFLTTLILICQSFRLVWTNSFTLETPSQFSSVWRVISIFSIENLFAFLPNFQVSAFVLASLPLFTLVISALQLFIMRFFREPKFFLNFLLRNLLRLQETVLFIPVAMILLIIIKYSGSNEESIEELAFEVSSQAVNNRNQVMIFSLVSLVILMILVAVNISCSYEMSHFKTKEILVCKFFCDSDLIEKSLVFGRCLFYVLISSGYYEVFLIISGLSFIIQAWVRLTYFAYYDNFMNKLKVLESLEGILFSVGFLTGKFMENQNIVAMLIGLLQPYVFVITLYVCGIRYGRIGKEVHEKSTKIEFEHFFRERIINRKKIPDFFVSTQKFWKNSKNELIFILEALYCKEILGNSMLGLNKLNVYKWNDFNVSTNYHIFHTMLVLESSSESSNSMRIVIFLAELERILRGEEFYFLALENWFFELSQKKASLARLKKAAINVTKTRIEVKKMYEKLMELYPNSKIAYKLYGTFLIHVLSDEVNGKPILERAKLEQSSKMQNKVKNNVFNDLTANIMLLSVGSYDLGKVLYISRSLCNILEIKYTDSKNYHLNDFIPKPYRNTHDRYMRKFFRYSETNKFSSHSSFVILTKSEFLIECQIEAETITREGNSMFVIHIDKKKLNRELAIISAGGVIYASSKGFGPLIGLENRNYAEENFFNLIETEIKVGINLVKIYDRNTGFLTPIEISIESKQIFSTEMIFVYCSKRVDQGFPATKSLRGRNFKIIMPHMANEIQEKLLSISFDESSENSPSIIDENIAAKTLKKSKLKTNKRNSLFISTENIFVIFKVLFYLIFFMILIIGIVVLVYIVGQVVQFADLDSINIFGNYKYSACYFSLMTRATYLTDTIQSAPLFSLDDIYSLKQDIKGYKTLLLDKYKQWSYCPVTEIFNLNNFVVYLPNSTRTSSYIDELLVFDHYADTLFTKLENGRKDYDEELFYIFINYFRLSFLNFDKLHDQITSCEEGKVLSLQTQVNYFFIAGSIAIFIIYLVLFVLVFVLSKRLDVIWKIFYDSDKHWILKLEPVLTERISSYHKQYLQKSETVLNFRTADSSKGFSHSFFYISHFCVLIIIVLVCYLISTLILYENLSTVLIKHSEMNNNELDRRSYITQLSFFMLDSVEKQYVGTANKYLQEFNPYQSPEEEQEYVLDELQSTELKYFQNDLENFYDPNDWGMLFDSISNEENFLKYGILTSNNHLIQETFYLSSTKPNFSDLNNYFEKLKNLTQIFNETKTNEVTISDPVINQAIQSLIGFYSALVALLLFLIVFWYRPLISEEKQLISQLEMIIESLPSLKPAKKN